MIDSGVLAFIGAAAVLTTLPGADTMLVLRSVLSRGRRAGFIAALGICCGLFVHAALSGFGLSILLVRSAALFNLVRWAGALYLIYLGAGSLRAAFKKEGSLEDSLDLSEPRQGAWTVRGAFIEGLMSNVLNPKVAIFYLAFLPQFISPGDPVLAKSMFLTAIFFVMGLTWLSFISLMVGTVRGWITNSGVRRWLEGIAGAVLVGFGVRVALERR
jgi:RhtB (resistance to homoserine/threonine) family protein